MTAAHPPIADTAGQPSADVRRDLAVAEFFETATKILRKLEPLIDLSIEEAKKESRR